MGFLEDSGRLTEKEAMAHPKRNEINKALGFDPQIDQKDDYIETGSSPFLPGDLLMLCSDGLTDLVNKKEMTAILLSGSSIAEKAQALVDAANVAGGKDNITVVLVRNHKKPLKIKATKPAPSKKKESNEEVDPPSPSAEAKTARRLQGKKASRSSLVPFLAVLCLLLAATCVWLLWRQNNNPPPAIVQPVAYIPNEAEIRLTDSLGLAARFLTLSDSLYNRQVVVGDTLFIRQDTLHINGMGTILQSDSSFAGPAFFATANNKVLVLENIIFKDFSTALVLQGRGLQLRNVQFLNCAVPVQRQVLLPLAQSLSGILRDTLILRNDSLPQ